MELHDHGQLVVVWRVDLGHVPSVTGEAAFRKPPPPTPSADSFSGFGTSSFPDLRQFSCPLTPCQNSSLFSSSTSLSLSLLARHEPAPPPFLLPQQKAAALLSGLRIFRSSRSGVFL